MEQLIEVIKIGMSDYSLYHLAWHLFIVVFCILITGAFSIADAISGCYVAWKLGQPIKSHLLRKTIEKMTVYWFFQTLLSMLGLGLSLFSWYDLPYLSIVAALGIGLVEIWSMIENHKRVKNGQITKMSDSIEVAFDKFIETIGGEEELIKLLRKRLGVEGGVQM